MRRTWHGRRRRRKRRAKIPHGDAYVPPLLDEHGIGSGGEYFGGNDAHLGRFNVFYHGALGGKYVPRAVLFDLKLGVIGAVRASQLGELFRPENAVNQNAKAHNTKAGHAFFLTPPAM